MCHMKRDKYINIIKDLLNDPTSELYKYRDNIYKETCDVFNMVILLMDEETKKLINKIAALRFNCNKTDEKIAAELHEINREDIYRTIKYIEEITSDVLLSVVIDYVLKTSNSQSDIFDIVLNDQEIEEDLEQDIRIRRALDIIDGMQKHYHINSENMKKHKQDVTMPTLFEF